MLNTKAFRRQRNVCGYLMSIPALIGVGVLIVYPIVFSFILSFTRIRASVVNVRWHDFGNYIWLFSESSGDFWNGLWVAFEFSVLSTILQTVLGFFLAYLLYSMGRGMQSVYRVLLYIPCVLPSAVVAVMWNFIYSYDVGLLFKLWELFGWEQVLWLNDPDVVLFSIIIANTWRFVGITMVLYFVNMNAVSKDVLEGATLDGANRWMILWRFIFPLTISSTKMNLVLSFVGGMKSFDMFFMLEGGSMPQTRPVGLIIFTYAFKQSRMGWAIVMSFMLSVILGAFTVITNKLMAKVEKSYE